MDNMDRKYIFISGGVVSSLGKGLTAASLARLLKDKGYKVSLQKLDPYYNVDPGLLSPLQHGECFVTEDGTCADLDLGHYERILDCSLRGSSSVTTGKIHRSIMEKELNGEYNGKTVQVIPHVTNEIIEKIKNAADEMDSEIAIIEIGGTVGDMESSPYFEAARQMKRDLPKYSCCFIHVTLIPYIDAASELKTKPTQHSVKTLRSIGIQPDIIVCRCNMPIPHSSKDKIALFCNVKPENVIQNYDTESLYFIPLMLEKEKISSIVCNVLKIEDRIGDFSLLKKFENNIKSAEKTVNIAIVGKYTQLKDAYLSVYEAILHSSYNKGYKPNISFVDSNEITKYNIHEKLKDFEAIIVPSGYGSKGSEGIINTLQYAREHKKPTIAIGYGMELAIVEIFRNVLNCGKINSLEIDDGCELSVNFIPEDRIKKGKYKAIARMGSEKINIVNGDFYNIYKEYSVYERHNNKYEINPDILEKLDKHGLKLAAKTSCNYPEAFILENHPFYVLTLYHPEFKSRPNNPHPLFNKLIDAIERTR